MISRSGEAKNATVYSCVVSDENCETVRSYWWHLSAVFEASTVSVGMRHVGTRFASLECACNTSLAVCTVFCNWRIGNDGLLIQPCSLLQMKPTRCTLMLSICIATSLHVSGNYVPIIRRTYCIYATLVFFTLYGWLSGLLQQTRQPPIQIHRYSKFSWWWAHSCPKHVEKLQ